MARGRPRRHRSGGAWLVFRAARPPERSYAVRGADRRTGPRTGLDCREPDVSPCGRARGLPHGCDIVSQVAFELKAVVGAEAAVGPLARTIGAPIAILPQQMQLLPATDRVLHDLGGRHGDVWDGAFCSLTRATAAVLHGASLRGAVAFLEIELFAGIGTRAAAVWEHGHLVFGPVLVDDDARSRPDESPVNLALRRLGVKVTAANDEFDAVGLGLHRTTDAWARPAES